MLLEYVKRFSIMRINHKYPHIEGVPFLDRENRENTSDSQVVAVKMAKTIYVYSRALSALLQFESAP